MNALRWLGRQGTRAIAGIVLLAVVTPAMGAALQPFVSEAVFVLLCIAFLRVDAVALSTQLGRPGRLVVALAWVSLAPPLLVGSVCLALGLPALAPALFVGLMLQSMASPMTSSPALAALMGLDATLALLLLVGSTALVPLTVPLFAEVFLGPVSGLSPGQLGLRLLGLLAGALVVAGVVRRWVGPAAIQRHAEALNGISVMILFIFVSAMMAGFVEQFLADPWRGVRWAGLSFALSLVMMGLTAWAFRHTGQRQALALAFVTTQRNMGLMLAVAGTSLEPAVWFYFAIAQFPIYLLPQLLQPLVRRWVVVPGSV